MKNVFLFTPPFTQLNTPYPATAYLKGFLNTIGISTFQADLGIEVIIKIFSREGLFQLFNHSVLNKNTSNNSKRIYTLRQHYIDVIDPTILFLQGRNLTLADKIAKRGYLPEASRFSQLDDLHWAFGSMGIQDKAKHLATLYLEDLADFIKECVDEHFGFSRYAERIGRSAHSFDELYQTLQLPLTYVDGIHHECLINHIKTHSPQLVAITVPFPGNLFSAFRAAAWIRQEFPRIKIALGGGYVNTELRTLTDKRVFEYFHFISLDDGEAPIFSLLEFIEGKRTKEELKRIFIQNDDSLQYYNYHGCTDFKQGEIGTPDYSDLLLEKYISVIEIANPMHRLWSDGRWNKLTMAHGCYWGKCTFCDITLPYISEYEPLTASIICDKMQKVAAQTNNYSFHFVDEAAPPALMRALALEIIQRKLQVSWWANIRFEKSFSRDLCILLKESGCIAVSGGLEVASNRLLNLIQKGVTVEQVAKVTQHFTQAGIMVHAYLMYGFPSQTEQETIDSLEMIRQMFQTGILQSGFWHQFALTAHSPINKNPEKYGIKIPYPELGSFANNDIEHIDLNGVKHEKFSQGLTKSLFNYMQHICLDSPLQDWFEFKVPKTCIDENFIISILNENKIIYQSPNARVVFIGAIPSYEIIIQSKKGRQRELMQLSFETKTNTIKIQIERFQGEWLMDILTLLVKQNTSRMTFTQLQKNYEERGLEDFDLFWFNKPMNLIHTAGLLIV